MADYSDMFLDVLNNLSSGNLGVQESPKNSYPFTDIYTSKEVSWIFVDIALAGFRRENISIKAEGNNIIVEAKADVIDTEKYDIHRKSIARRDAKRVLTLANKYVGGDIKADFVDGMLKLKIQPKEDYSKIITINPTGNCNHIPPMPNPKPIPEPLPTEDDGIERT